MLDRMIDIHCHVLPNIDDGPNRIEESIEMVSQAVAQGVETIIATPHYIPGELEYDRDEVFRKVNELQKRVDQTGLRCKIYPGMELYLIPELISHIDKRKIISLAESRYLLVEFPSRELSVNLINLLHEIRIRGYEPIIAHPERNSKIIENVELVNELFQQNVLLQINASSILGKNGQRSRDLCREFLEQGLVSFIASDGHSAGRRSIDIEEAFKEIERLGFHEKQIFKFNAKKLLEQGEIENDFKLYKRSKGGLLKALKRLIG